MQTALGDRHRLLVPAPEYCTDNGAMIAAMGSLLYRRGEGLSPPELFAVAPQARTEAKGAT